MGLFGTKGLAITFVSNNEDNEVRKKVQERLKGNGEDDMPGDSDSYCTGWAARASSARRASRSRS